MVFDIDLTGLEQLLNDAGALDFAGLGLDLVDDGEAYVREIMQAEIYSRPESPSYERSHKLIDTAKGYATIQPDGFEVTLEAFGGNRGELYGLPVETGTYGSFTSLDKIMRDARAQNSLEPLDYGRGESGMRARPSVTVAIAQLERDLEDKLLEAIDKATR